MKWFDNLAKKLRRTAEEVKQEPQEERPKEETQGKKGTAGTVDDTTLVNEMPLCIKCYRTMLLQSKGVLMSRMSTPTENFIAFCPKCGETAFVMFHAKINRNDPKKKVKLAVTTYWSNPLHRHKTNTRLTKLKNSLDKYDFTKKEQERVKENPVFN